MNHHLSQLVEVIVENVIGSEPAEDVEWVIQSLL